MGIDISTKGIRLASLRLQNSAFVVTDIWLDWPVRTSSVDLLISIFAPRNFPEMARVLRPGGLLALAYPGPSHLVELRREFSMLTILPGKLARYRRAAEKQFEQTSTERYIHRSILGRDEILDLILMGPSGRKITDQVLSAAAMNRMEVTFDIEIIFARFNQKFSTDVSA